MEENNITFVLHSPDGDQGYPGALELRVRYTLTDNNTVCIEYEGVPTEDTIINVTNHSYFNLNGHSSGSILEHLLWVDADSFLMTDEKLIPTGEIVPVNGTPMDFRTRKAVGRDIDTAYLPLACGNGYDHNWCLNNNGVFCKIAEVMGDQSGIIMEVSTDMPGMQIYSGNFLRQEQGKNGVIYEHRQGMCFETQHYPDAVNHSNFPSPICQSGHKFKSKTEYLFRY